MTQTGSSGYLLKITRETHVCVHAIEQNTQEEEKPTRKKEDITKPRNTDTKAGKKYGAHARRATVLV